MIDADGGQTGQSPHPDTSHAGVDAAGIEAAFGRVAAEVGKAFVGQHELVEAVLVALLAEGNVLIEGPPGLGKTLLVNSLSRVLGVGFRRIQFTPDLMPADVTGHGVYDLRERSFTFNPGPVFTNLLLADEVNRAPAKTQAALLEAMQERQVTVDGITRPLGRPFLVIATQNPLEQEGTYPLPEAQLDRFLFKLDADYPDHAAERDILQLFLDGRDHRDLDAFGLTAVLDGGRITDMQRRVRSVIVEPPVVDYIAAVVRRTRDWPSVEVGASPRAGVGLLVASRAAAAVRGRDFVVPDDVKRLAPWVLRHRVRLRPDAEIEGVAVDDTIAELLDAVEAPRAGVADPSNTPVQD